MLIHPNHDEVRRTYSRSARACALIRECIDEERQAVHKERTLSKTPFSKPRSCAEQFLGDVRAWLHAVRHANSKGWHPDDAWQYAFKQHLAVIVGPNARTALGRDAATEGYRMLAVEFRVLFGRFAPQHPTLLGLADETAAQSGEAEFVATLQALPAHLRCDERLGTRLLAVIVRSSVAAPVRLTDEARSYLDELQRLAGART